MISKWRGTSDRERVQAQLGGLAWLTSDGDLAFYIELRKYIGMHGRPLRVLKITRRGQALVCDNQYPGLRYTVPLRNVRYHTL